MDERNYPIPANDRGIDPKVSQAFLQALDECVIDDKKVVEIIDVDRKRVQNRLLDVLETDPFGSECKLLRTQLSQLLRIIEVVRTEPESSEYGELHSALYENGGLTPMGIHSEGKIISLAQERYLRRK